MNWILALFAFAGIMAVMSTIASVVVEAVHKVFALRGGGLQEMLRALHDGVVMPLDPEYPDITQGIEGGATKRAAQFSKQMTRSPAYGGKGRWWWIANVPFLNIFTRRFENLSKLQFVEQLTQTDYGQRLSGMSRPQVKQSLNRLVYEFDRYGVGQTDYFRARAKVLTMIVALFIVSIGNINALAIYSHLATNQSALNQMLNTFNSTAALESIAAGKKQETSAGLNASAQGQANLSDGMSSIASDIRVLSNAGFPVGRNFFPYCDNPENLNCDIKQDAKPISLFGLYDSAAIPRMFTLEGIHWFLGMIVTAGLIGLGANFWFNIFRAMAAFALRNATQGNSRVNQAAVKPATVSGEVRRPKEVKGTLAAPGDEPDLDLLTDAFLTVSGKDINETTGEFDSVDLSLKTNTASPDAVFTGDMPIRPGPPPKHGKPNSIRKFRG